MREDYYETYDGMCEECYPVENRRTGLRRRRVLTANIAFLQQAGFTALAGSVKLSYLNTT